MFDWSTLVVIPDLEILMDAIPEAPNESEMDSIRGVLFMLFMKCSFSSLYSKTCW